MGHGRANGEQFGGVLVAVGDDQPAFVGVRGDGVGDGGLPELRKDCSQAVCEPAMAGVHLEGLLLNLQHGLAEALAGETEAVALDRHVLGQALEFLGGFQPGLLAGL